MIADDKERAHVYISGDVQGVLFRDSARQKAEELDLNGWVKNMPDGRVEALFEGAANAVQEMLGWCKEGPSQATVEDVDAEHEDSEEDLEGFEVR